MDKILRYFHKLHLMNGIKNLHTILLLSVLFIFSCGGEGQQQTKQVEQGFYKVGPTEFLSKYNSMENSVMIDVRTENEFKAGALVKEAILIDYHGKDFIQDMVVLDTEAPMFVYCYSGGRSSKAIYKMKQLGFKHIYELEGGYDRWQREQKK